jgi:hypothetical protein
MNDLFISVKNCSMYNYADDNTVKPERKAARNGLKIFSK